MEHGNHAEEIKFAKMNVRAVVSFPIPPALRQAEPSKKTSPDPGAFTSNFKYSYVKTKKQLETAKYMVRKTSGLRHLHMSRGKWSAADVCKFKL